MSRIAVSTTVDGDDVEFPCQSAEASLEVLRDHLGLARNRYRCTGYVKIVRAVQDAGRATKGE